MADTFTARKLWCLDQVVRDKRATHFDFRFAYYIASVTDRATGEARFKQVTAAAALGVTRRAIQLSADRLKALGHLDISFSPGRTHLNGYRLSLEKANVGSPLEEEKANNGTPFSDGKGEQRDHKRRTTRHEKANRHSHQSIPCFIPCLFPSRAREPAIAEALGSLGAALEARIGADEARAWFGQASISDVAGDVLTIELPTRFIRSRVQTEFHQDLLVCCSSLLPRIRQVKLVAVSEVAA